MLNKKAFSLIELIVVITITSIFVGLSAPKIIQYVRDAQVTTLYRDLDTLRKATNEYILNNDKKPISKTITPKGPIISYLENKNDIGDFYILDIDKLQKNITPLKNKGTYIYSKSTDSIYYMKGIENSKKIRIYELPTNSFKDFLALRWLRETDMIVTNNKNPKLNNAPLGSVIWNYNSSTNDFYNFSKNTKVSNLSVNTAINSLIDAYTRTNNSVFLDRAKIVGQFLQNSCFDGTVYGKKIKLVVSMQQANDNWLKKYDEIYIQDISYSAYSCFRMYQITKDETYKKLGFELINTLHIAQDLFKDGELPKQVKGCLPLMFIHQGNNNFVPSWRLVGLDNIDMIVNAYTYSCNFSNDIKYKKHFELYKKSILNLIKNYGCINKYGFLYETYGIFDKSWKAINFNQLNGKWGVEEPFTTDQYFYGVLGISKLDTDLGKQLLNKADTLHKNYLFAGQYNINGTPNIDSFEIINTALYLQTYKQIFSQYEYKDIEKTLIDNHYNKFKKDINSFGAYTWSPNSYDDIIESIATCRIISSILN